MSTKLGVRLADFLLNPEIDDARLELIDGEVSEKPMPNWDHGESAFEIGTVLRPFGRVSVEPRAIIERAGASPLPDVAFYRKGKPAKGDYMRTPPNVAVEIRSPGQSMAFLRRKAQLYMGFGVESVWLVDLDREEVLVLDGDSERTLRPGERLTTPAVPGLDVDVAVFFPTEEDS